MNSKDRLLIKQLAMNQSSFPVFIYHNQKQLLIAIAVTVFQFIIFKSFYPYPDFYPDSLQYISAASQNLDINFYPIGYSKFLLYFHQITASATALVGFQYFFLELSSLYFFLTVRYLFSPQKLTQTILFGFFFLNPLFIYLSNHVTSDAIFAALSICWMTNLLWIFHSPRSVRLFINAILLFCCFTIRNNAYYYIAISTIEFVISKGTVKYKLVGMIFPLLFVLPFIFLTQTKCEELTGTKQYSLFTGWQLSNNALYMYKHIQVDSSALPSASSRELNRLSRTYFDDTGPILDTILPNFEGNFFIKASMSPLKQYLSLHYHTTNYLSLLKAWANASEKYNEYGKWLIQRHPLAYFQYFVLPNIRNYLLPPMEKLSKYNNNVDTMSQTIQNWFQYKTPKIVATSWIVQNQILFLFPYLFFFLNILLFGLTLFLFLKRKGLVLSSETKLLLLLGSSFLLFNFIFCICTTIIVLRYEFFPMIMALTLPLLLLEILDNRNKSANSSISNQIISLKIQAYAESN
jgi:hypothetical protein